MRRAEGRRSAWMTMAGHPTRSWAALLQLRAHGPATGRSSWRTARTSSPPPRKAAQAGSAS
eukprot:5844254-Alexandrium_andersonii.AAC.1